MQLLKNLLNSFAKNSPLLNWKNNKKIFLTIGSFFIFILAFFISFNLRPVAKTVSGYEFIIRAGEGFGEIVFNLEQSDLIRSSGAFKILSLLTGSAHKFKPGFYELSSHLSSKEIMSLLIRGTKEIQVVIPEGLSVFEVDRILSNEKIIKAGELVDYDQKEDAEGKLFPDTYKFFVGSKVEDVASIFLKNFNSKINPLLKIESSQSKTNLILASLVQEEVWDFKEQQLVAGIIKKRLKIGMPLQIDATICYLKKIKLPNPLKTCYPLTPLDMKIDSPYNTYLYKGLPPGPISSPGISAMEAVIKSQNSPFWFYLSDIDTGKTYFAKDLDEHNRNITTYLKN